MAVGPQISPQLSLSVPRLGPEASKVAVNGPVQSPRAQACSPAQRYPVAMAPAPAAPAAPLRARRSKVSFERPVAPLRSGEMSPADWSGSLRRGQGPLKPVKPEPPRSRSLSDLAQHLGLEEVELMGSPRATPSTPSRVKSVKAAQAAAPKAQMSHVSHVSPFGAKRRQSPRPYGPRADRDLWELEALQPSAEPSGVPFLETSEASESLPDYTGYNWPSEQFEPLGSMIRSLEFQVSALFELMDAHSAEADASVLEVINRKREAVDDTFQALKEAVWWTRRRREQPCEAGPRLGRTSHFTGDRRDRSGLQELEALQSQLDVRISQVMEVDCRDIPLSPTRQDPKQVPTPAPLPRGADLASSRWFKELEASWAAGAAAAKPPAPKPVPPAPQAPAAQAELTLEPMVEPVTKSAGVEGLVLTPTYFHFRSDE
mmetsp:Transcript_41376/g.89686  ORF Transcript_41376/g.89686 Transcript_41376/m.89686 type:complete len:430 (-) Transcript_41376:101-1390(-)